ncbi:glycosyltransferase [Kibdelosporangium persicum]|uniref:UDP-glucoronosyl and UDP-glucosyl transferase n=1 Tax=Kibdelosporangium persicum TaxID=2698649 RepID=A0ABX2FKK4_9PSEU|nr:glycosyltransferase [Kibdelosporangium persicum]NRN71402.1 UDP-glucoronosyl and UDP-glucosyl transferase [Kibdelosporangium persicum]
MTAQSPGPVLFASPSHPSLFGPLATIATELDRRGVEGLWFGGSEDRKADVEALSPRGGIGFVQIGRYVPELQPGNWTEETFQRLNSRSRLRAFAAFMDQSFVGPHGAEFYEQSLAAIDRIRPALVVADLGATWMFDAAMTRGVPYVINSPTLVSYLYAPALSWTFPAPFSGLPLRMTTGQKVANLLFSLARIGIFLQPSRMKATRAFIAERAALGIKNTKGLLGPYADAAVAVIGHSQFGIEYPHDRAPDCLEMVGPVMPSTTAAPDPDIMGWVEQHRSIVYLGFGAMNRPTRRQIEAILTAAGNLAPDHHVLWSLPKSQHRLLPTKIPANVRIETWVPQVDVLAHPHVRVFMSQGGNGTHHGLYFGKPLLLMPHTWEARDGAVRFVDSGAALLLRDTTKLDSAEITTKLRRLFTDDGLRERALHWKERLRQAGGVSAAADIILRHRDSQDRKR